MSIYLSCKSETAMIVETHDQLIHVVNAFVKTSVGRCSSSSASISSLQSDRDKAYSRSSRLICQDSRSHSPNPITTQKHPAPYTLA